MDKDIREFYDEFIRFKREVTDTLENLDEGNFSGNMKKLIARLGSSSAGFEAYADAKQAVARMFAEYKTEINKSIASVEAVADENSSKINAIAKYEGDIKSIASIEETADANGAFIKMLVSAGSNKDPDEVEPFEIAGIYMTAMNNNSTEIKLNADVIKFGDYASVDSIGNFYSKKLFGSASGEYIDGDNKYPGFFYAEVDSGGFTEDNKLYGADFYIKSVIPFYGSEGTVIYGFHYGTTPGETSESINFVVGEQGTNDVKSVWGYNYGKNAFFPKGVWDFSSCSVSNIPLYFS